MRGSLFTPLLGCLALMEGVTAACARDNLLNALLNHTPDSYQFCSAYISVPATSTVTVYTSTCTLSTYSQTSTVIHPLYLFNLQRRPYGTTVTPLSYNTAAPTPSPVPGSLQAYGWPYRRVRRSTENGSLEPEAEEKEEEEVVVQLQPVPTPKAELLKRRSPPLPTYLAASYPASRVSSGCSCLSVPAATTTTLYQAAFSITVTTTCTTYIPTTTASYPAHCAPSLHVNNPYPAAHPSYVVVPNFTVPSKMDCCMACSSNFNCVWWKFTFPPNSANGWNPGQCRWAYYIGTTSDPGMADAGIPATCPNGVTRAIDNPDYSHVGVFDNINHDGYNYGQCGGGSNIFQSNQDGGAPNDAYSHTCGGYNGEPSSNPPGCAA